MDKIFVSIACYMDKDLINTINDCFNKAKNSKNIIIGICLQYDTDDEFFKEYENHPQIKIKKMHYKEAKGPMYARYFCTKLVTDELYFLQIDCHTRFYQDWDVIIINELKKCEILHDKCVISHYPLNIKNMHDENNKKKIGLIRTFRYIGVDAIKSHGSIDNIPNEPKQSFGIMAAMIFMRSSALREVPYDIKTYHGYHSEEQFYYSARLYTNGYNCYTPTQHILAMEYCTNRDRLTVQSKIHLATDSNVWNQRTWRKCKYYLRLDTLENVNYQEYIDDILENKTLYGLGNNRSIIDFYKMTNIHNKLLELFPFYKKYVNFKFHKDFNHMLEINNPGKKIGIVTQNTPNLINSYYKNIRQNHLMYCNKHDYTYYSFYENLAEDVNKGESPKTCWSKVKACLNVVKNHDYIMWMDADAIFANQNIKIEDRINKYPEKDYYLSKDPKTHFINSGVMIWKNSKESIDMLNRWWNMEHISYGKGGDQIPLGNFLRTNNEYSKYWHHYEERELNCYPTNYHSYDYIIHFMGIKSKININNRVIKFNNLLKFEKDNSNIYISLTCNSENYDKIDLIINNLMNNTVKPYKIILSIYENDYKLNKDLLNDKLNNYIKSNIIFINTIKIDYGPLLKYIGIIKYVDDNKLIEKGNFGVIIIKENLYYDNYLIEEYLNYNLNNNRSILTFYHMSNIKVKINNNNTLMIKSADSIFLPKYFFTINCNPSFDELINNIIKDNQNIIYNDDELLSAYSFIKHIDKISLNSKIKSNKRTCYKYAYDIKNINVNNISNILENFNKYYSYDKYSNVKFYE